MLHEISPTEKDNCCMISRVQSRKNKLIGKETGLVAGQGEGGLGEGGQRHKFPVISTY